MPTVLVLWLLAINSPSAIRRLTVSNQLRKEATSTVLEFARWRHIADKN